MMYEILFVIKRNNLETKQSRIDILAFEDNSPYDTK